jgi:arsenate reductase
MVDYPILMERPIAVKGEKAVIARPLDKIKEII